MPWRTPPPPGPTAHSAPPIPGAASLPVAGDLPSAGRAPPGPLQRAGGPLVQRRPPGRGQFVVHRVPDKRVRERQPGAVWGSGQHTRRDGGVEQAATVAAESPVTSASTGGSIRSPSTLAAPSSDRPARQAR